MRIQGLFMGTGFRLLGKGFNPFVSLEFAGIVKGRTLGQQTRRKLRQINTSNHEIPELDKPIADISALNLCVWKRSGDMKTKKYLPFP